MINRIIIRIKILQVVYAYYQKGNKELSLAENELMFSLQKSYDLYHYFLLLITELTDVEQKRQDLRKHKYLATEEEKNPNTRFIDNRFSKQLAANRQLTGFVNEKGRFWDDESNFVKTLLDEIISSTLYKEYLQSEDTYTSDKEFWKKIFKTLICDNESILDILEDRSIYWNDDADIVSTFVLKTINKFEESNAENQLLLPMFKDDEDRLYAVNLLRNTIINEEEYNQRIIKHIKNWDVERIANIDLYVMQIAIAEILNFPTIPVSVSLNEYIDIAKFYSTPKSGTFINGILDAIVSDLTKEHLLFKK